MDLPVRTKLPHTIPQWVAEGSWFFITIPREPGMATVIKNWKKYVAGKHGVDWQRDFFDHRLRDHHEVDEKTNYILMNPVRKGLCERAEDWVWIYRPNDGPPSLLG